MLEVLWKFVSRQFERWILQFHWKIWGFTLKKLKLGRDPHVDAPLRKKLKHQTEVDNNPWWLVPISFLYDNLYWKNKYFFDLLYIKSFLAEVHNFTAASNIFTLYQVPLFIFWKHFDCSFHSFSFHAIKFHIMSNEHSYNHISYYEQWFHFRCRTLT